jgi:uncharacterized 2Fe-2S/4Fe-4S cluster protein (DUF4445 family)
MPNVTFINEGRTFSVETGISILEAARRFSVAMHSPCNALGTCGKCGVYVKRNDLTEYLLSCQTKISEDVEIFIEDKTAENRSLKILSSGVSGEYPLKPFIAKRFDGKNTYISAGGRALGIEPGDTTASIYGVVADIGTTTLVAALVDLNTGSEIASAQRLNPQSVYAQDVLSRIHFAGKDDGTAVLQSAFLSEFKLMLKELSQKAHIYLSRIYEVVYSGNTAMLHLACGINPKSLGVYPYISKVKGGEYLPAENLPISPFGHIYLPPVISAFVGADITSGILAAELYKAKDTTIFIDVGTNGEMVIAKGGRLAATSTAAGPAFEGMNISCGMRAAAGAIEAFRIMPDYSVDMRVIGGGEAKGICGSGLLDIAGELVRCGIIDKSGKFVSADRDPTESLKEKDGKKFFYLTDEVYLSQKDVRQLQLAKGAVRSGIEALLDKFALSAEGVDRVEIAGSFGYHLNKESLVNIGLIPPSFSKKVKFAGNTSLSGGKAFLLNTDFRDILEGIVKSVSSVELADSKDFEKLFVRSLGF